MVWIDDATRALLTVWASERIRNKGVSKSSAAELAVEMP